MKVTKVMAVILIGLVMSGLLLFAASRSFEEKQPDSAEVEHQAEEVAVGTQIEPPCFVANPFCLACHADLEEEELVVEHLIAGIGCERCHGESERHRSDEENATPPEIMYPRAKINPTCMMCHPRENIEHVNDHKPLLAGAKTIFDPEIDDSASGSADPEICCADCHTEKHRMKVRTVRWDKATGEILEE